jgi:uncharacterized protein
VLAYETGANEWRKYDNWPQVCSEGCAKKSRPLYLLPGGKLGFDAPAAGAERYDEYISDPAKPVTYRERPTLAQGAENSGWGDWLVDDQRFAASRTDVLVYQTEPLREPVRLAGEPIASLFASTSGTDSDWVVKLIDVYPDEVAAQPGMGGYQLMVSADIFRGRYRESFEQPRALAAGKPLAYRFALPTANHVFRPGHRIMVQVQSSWFPLYDRNPQTFVKSIFEAKPQDFRKAVQRVYRAPGQASFVELPLVTR